MKAHIIPNTERKTLEEKRRWLKLTCAAIHSCYGFGAQRIEKFIDEFTEISSQRSDDPIFWSHIDKLLIDQLKMQFDRENYEEVDR